MYEDYNKRAKTANYIQINSNKYIPKKKNRFRDLYINQSPTFYNQYRYDIDNQNTNTQHVHYVYRQRPVEYYDEGRFENFNNSLKNLKSPNELYFKKFNYTQKNDDRNMLQKSVNNNMTKQNKRNPNEIYYLDNNINKRNPSNSQDNKNQIKFKRIFTSNSYNIENNENKLYSKNQGYPKKMNRNTVNTIAQKICNIVIQGNVKKDKNQKNQTKSEKKPSNKKTPANFQISKIEPRNLNLNKISNYNKSHIEYNREENEDDNENEEIEESRRNEHGKYFIRRESNEEYEEEENGISINEYNYKGYKKNNKMSKEEDEQYEDENNEHEQEEQYEDESYENGGDNNRENNREDIEEVEENENNEQNFERLNNGKEMNDKIKKNNNYYQLQKENEIELGCIKEEKKINQLNIIKDDYIEIHGEKKPLKLEINSESNLSLIKKENKPIIEIQKVQNYEQPRDYQRRSNKKQILKVSKDTENDVNIIHNPENVPIYEIENVQNFNQERFKERRSAKKRNNMNKYNIAKLQDANLFLEKTEYEPELEIQKVDDFIELMNREKKVIKKNIKLKIVKIKDANIFFEKIDDEPKMEIQNVHNYYQKRSKERKLQNKSRRYKLKISKLREDDIEIINLPSISICQQENIEIKNKNKNNNVKRKKKEYNRLKRSNRIIYQYQAIKPTINESSISKISRFILKGKPKKIVKRPKNIIKNEIIYTYNSPSKIKTELTIGGNITNAVKPSLSKISEQIDSEINKINIIEQNIKNQKYDSESTQVINHHIIGVSPEKEGNNKRYLADSYPDNNLTRSENLDDKKINDLNNGSQIDANNNDSNNKSQNISIPQSKQDRRHGSKTYISARRMRQSSGVKKEENTDNKFSNVSSTFINENKNIPENNKNITSSVNTLYITTTLKKEEPKEDVKQNNAFKSTEVRKEKKEKKQNLENNKMFISQRASSSSKNSDKNDIKSEMKNNNINRILINSSNNSPVRINNLDISGLRTQPNNFNRINLDSESQEKNEKIEDKNLEEKKEQNDKKEEEKKESLNEAISKTSVNKNIEFEKTTYSFLNDYNKLDNQELSEYTKAYLNSYMTASRPELSDFSKQFLNTEVTNNFTTRPELSNITRAYLFSQNEDKTEDKK